MFRSYWIQHISDYGIQTSTKIKVWFWHNTLAKNLQIISYIYPFDLFSLLWLVL